MYPLFMPMLPVLRCLRIDFDGMVFGWNILASYLLDCVYELLSKKRPRYRIIRQARLQMLLFSRPNLSEREQLL